MRDPNPPNLRFVPTLTEVLSPNPAALANSDPSAALPQQETAPPHIVATTVQGAETLEAMIEARIHHLAPELAAFIAQELRPILKNHT